MSGGSPMGLDCEMRGSERDRGRKWTALRLGSMSPLAVVNEGCVCSSGAWCTQLSPVEGRRGRGRRACVKGHVPLHVVWTRPSRGDSQGRATTLPSAPASHPASQSSTCLCPIGITLAAEISCPPLRTHLSTQSIPRNNSQYLLQLRRFLLIMVCSF